MEIIMTAENLKNWLKTQDGEAEGRIAVGCIDGSKERFIGVYDAKGSAAGQRFALAESGRRAGFRAALPC